MVVPKKLYAWQKAAITALVYALMLVSVQYIMDIGLLEIRLGAFLPPLVGMLWGFPAAIGTAIGNIVRDIVVGDDPAAIPIGAVANFIYAYAPYRLWLATNLDNSDDEFFYPTTKCLLRFFVILAISAGFGTVFLIAGVTLVGYDFPGYFARQVFIANFDFPFIITTPILIILAGRGWIFPQQDGVLTLAKRAPDEVIRPLSYTITFWVIMSCVFFVAIFSTFFIGQEIMEGEKDIIAIFNNLYSSQFLIVHMFFFVSLILLRQAEKHLSEPLAAITDSVRAFSRQNGELSAVSLPPVKDENELGVLRNTISRMMDDIVEYVRKLNEATKERERIRAELSIAHEIQTSMLPKIFPAYPEKTEIDLYASMNAAKAVGGDFYDFYLLDENHLVVTVADVSGKGVSASLFMVIAKTILKNFIMTAIGEDDLAAAVACTNEQLYQNNDAMMFVTAFIGMLDLKTGRFIYVNAGHNPPLLYRASEDKFNYLEVKKNFVLGCLKKKPFTRQEITLSPGDRLFIYTDGVSEALNEEKELYGEERLLECLNHADAGNKSCMELVEAVRSSLEAHVKTAEQSDDITMMAVVYNG